MRIPNAWPESIVRNATQLRDRGVLTIRRKRIGISERIPDAFLRFVRKTSASIYDRNDVSGVERVRTRTRPRDGAPLLFGTDVRLRIFLALAKYGPLNILDLRRLLGGSEIRRESEAYAMFTRAGVVFEWDTDEGRCATLDPRFPVIRELTHLLRKMEARYPIRALERKYPIPSPPELSGAWDGDYRVLFGGPIQTAVLLTLAALGWSFEALCVSYAVGYDRVVTKKVVKRLEDQNLIAGDRKRKPGFNVRVLRLSEEFCAQKELAALLRRYVEVWPEIKAEVEACMQRLAPRTKAHLLKRQLLK